MPVQLGDFDRVDDEIWDMDVCNNCHEQAPGSTEESIAEEDATMEKLSLNALSHMTYHPEMAWIWRRGTADQASETSSEQTRGGRF